MSLFDRVRFFLNKIDPPKRTADTAEPQAQEPEDAAVESIDPEGGTPEDEPSGMFTRTNMMITGGVAAAAGAGAYVYYRSRR